MNALSNIIYNFGKFWLAMILFAAMIISTIVSLPFIIAGKLYDMWRSSELYSNKMIN